LAGIFVLLGPKWAFAGDVVVSQFQGGLDTQDSPAELDPSQAQDLLNVNIQPGGAAIFKRDGYGVFQTTSFSTAPIHGGYHFQQTGGSDVQLWGNATKLSAIVSDASPVVIATGTDQATWQCADSQGFAYCLTSSRDTAVKTDGSTANTSYSAGIPLGTMLTFTPTQLVVAGVSGNESTIYISQQNAFTTFTVGVLPSSAFTEPIASPGSRITHLAYYFGKLFWWKDQSFGYATFTNQNDWQLTIVSNQIGTLDNSDAFWNSSGFDSGAKFSGIASANAEKSPGGIFFRGQDNHLYVYDGYYLTRLSRAISPTVTAASRRKANLWKQSSQSELQTGSIVPTRSLSTTISAGDVIVSSFGANERSQSTGWGSGTSNNFAIGTSSLSLVINNSGTVLNNDFEGTCASNVPANWTQASGPFVSGCSADACTLGTCTVNPRTGSNMLEFTSDPSAFSTTMAILDANTLSTLSSTVIPQTDVCGWTQSSISAGSNIGKRFKLRISGGGASYTTTQSYILGGDITFYYNGRSKGSGKCFYIDDIANGSSTITSGSYTSQTYDTGLSSAIYQLSDVGYTLNTATPLFGVLTATATTGPWTQIITATGTNVYGNRYAKLVSSLSVTSSQNALTAIGNIAVVARSTGTYYSAVNNAPALTSWGTIGITDSVNASTITYYSRSSTNSFTVLSSTPSWVLQPKNSNITASTGTYMQLRADFALVTATDTPTMSDFTFNWFEGTAASQAFITYFNDAIWFSVSSSSSASVNNRIFYWDILNGAWLIYDIPSNGFLVENNRLYFGDPSSGKIFLFGSVTTDNGANINSYWRSKSFLGSDPFVQNEFVQADFVLGQSSTTLTYTYTLDSKTSTAYTMTVYDSAASLIQRNFLLPVGKIGKYYDFQIGDNSSNPAWRLMGHRAHYNALNWRPVTN